MGQSARAQKVPSCARLCGRDVHRNFFPIIPLSNRSIIPNVKLLFSFAICMRFALGVLQIAVCTFGVELLC